MPVPQTPYRTVQGTAGETPALRRTGALQRWPLMYQEHKLTSLHFARVDGLFQFQNGKV
jgi:hypothetical protein